jgi:hypothetical protein
VQHSARHSEPGGAEPHCGLVLLPTAGVVTFFGLFQSAGVGFDSEKHFKFSVDSQRINRILRLLFDVQAVQSRSKKLFPFFANHKHCLKWTEMIFSREFLPSVYCIWYKSL